MLALKTVIDVPESDVVSLLHSSVVVARQMQSDDNAMQVDAATDSSIPPLSSVLSLCTTYTMTAPALRLAIRQQLSDAAELTAILQTLCEWIDAWCAEDITLLPERTKKDLHGALVPALEEKQKGALPPLEKASTQCDPFGYHANLLTDPFSGFGLPPNTTRLIFPHFLDLPALTRHPSRHLFAPRARARLHRRRRTAAWSSRAVCPCAHEGGT